MNEILKEILNLREILLPDNNIFEEVSPQEVNDNISSVKSIINGKRNVGTVFFDIRRPDYETTIKLINDNGLNTIKIENNKHLFIVYNPEFKDQAEELANIYNSFGGYVHPSASPQIHKRIGEILGYYNDHIKNFNDNNMINENDLKNTITDDYLKIRIPFIRDFITQEVKRDDITKLSFQKSDVIKDKSIRLGGEHYKFSTFTLTIDLTFIVNKLDDNRTSFNMTLNCDTIFILKNDNNDKDYLLMNNVLNVATKKKFDPVNLNLNFVEDREANKMFGAEIFNDWINKVNGAFFRLEELESQFGFSTLNQ